MSSTQTTTKLEQAELDFYNVVSDKTHATVENLMVEILTNDEVKSMQRSMTEEVIRTNNVLLFNFLGIDHTITKHPKASIQGVGRCH